MSIDNQIYEKYWSTTFAYTDIYGEKFCNSLDIITKFIDEHKITQETFSASLYTKLQNQLISIYNINDTSARKIINQYVRLGFIEYKLAGYHEKSKKFLKSNKSEQKLIFSNIVYENSSFNRSVTVYSPYREINFLLKTLAYSGPLTEDDRIALMLTDLSKIKKDFLTRNELEEKKRYAQIINFKERKYNQISHLSNLLSKLSDVYMDSDKILYISEDDLPIEKIELEKRDPYLHRLYKSELKEESKNFYEKAICYMEKLDYPSLVASHIKPFRNSQPKEQYDKNNGLLLSRGMDALFDKGYISFNDDGSILISNRLSSEVQKHLQKYSIDKKLLNEERLKYLKYNREKIFK